MLAQVQVFVPLSLDLLDLTSDLTWDLTWELDLDLSLTIPRNFEKSFCKYVQLGKDMT